MQKAMEEAGRYGMVNPGKAGEYDTTTALADIKTRFPLSALDSERTSAALAEQSQMHALARRFADGERGAFLLEDVLKGMTPLERQTFRSSLGNVLSSGHYKREGWQATGEGLLRGAVQMTEAFEDLSRMWQEDDPAHEFYRLANRMRRSADTLESGDWLTDSFNGAVAMLPDLVAGVGATAAGGPAGGIAYWTVREMPDAQREFEQFGMNKKQARLWSLVTSPITGSIEHAQTMLLKGPQAALGGLKRSLYQKAAGWVANYTGAVGLESAEELAQYLTREAAKFIYDKTRDLEDQQFDAREFADNFVKTAEKAVGVSMFLLLPGHIATARPNGETAEQIKSLATSPLDRYRQWIQRQQEGELTKSPWEDGESSPADVTPEGQQELEVRGRILTAPDEASVRSFVGDNPQAARQLADAEQLTEDQLSGVVDGQWDADSRDELHRLLRREVMRRDADVGRRRMVDSSTPGRVRRDTWVWANLSQLESVDPSSVRDALIDGTDYSPARKQEIDKRLAEAGPDGKNLAEIIYNAARHVGEDPGVFARRVLNDAGYEFVDHAQRLPDDAELDQQFLDFGMEQLADEDLAPNTIAEEIPFRAGRGDMFVEAADAISGQEAARRESAPTEVQQIVGDPDTSAAIIEYITESDAISAAQRGEAFDEDLVRKGELIEQLIDSRSGNYDQDTIYRTVIGDYADRLLEATEGTVLSGVGTRSASLKKPPSGARPGVTTIRIEGPISRAAFIGDIGRVVAGGDPNEVLIGSGVSFEVASVDPDARTVVVRETTLPDATGNLSFRMEEQQPLGMSFRIPSVPAVDPVVSQVRPPRVPRSNHEVVRYLEQAVGIPVQEERRLAAKAALGQYDRTRHVARTKWAGDIGSTAHEVAHHIENTTDAITSAPMLALRQIGLLDYDAGRQNSREGFAEYVRMWWMGEDYGSIDISAWEQHFNEWLTQNGDWAVRLGRAKAYVDGWRAQGREAQLKANLKPIGSKPPVAETVASRMGERMREAYRVVKDAGFPIQTFESAAARSGHSPSVGEGIKEIYDAFNQTAPKYAEDAIFNGVFTLGDQPVRVNGTPLAKAMGEIAPKEYDDWSVWAWARHSKEAIEKSGGAYNPGMSLADADFIFTNNGMNLSPEKLDRFEVAAQALTDHNNALLDMAVDAGLLTADSAVAMKQAWDTYLPLQRVKEKAPILGGAGAIRPKSPVRRRTEGGSGLQVIDPLQATINRTVGFYQSAQRQIIWNQIIDTAESVGGLGGWIMPADPSFNVTTASVGELRAQLESAGVDPQAFDTLTPQQLEQLVTIWRPQWKAGDKMYVQRIDASGNRRVFEIREPSLFEAVEAIAPYKGGPVIEMIGQLAGLMRLGRTGINPAFGARNMVRDVGVFLMQRKEAKGIRSIVDIPRTMLSYVWAKVREFHGGEAAKSDPIVKLWEASGGPLANLVGLDYQSTIRTAQSMLKSGIARRYLGIVWQPISLKGASWGLPRRVVGNLFNSTLDSMREAFSTSEVGPRLAEYRAVLMKYYTVDQLRSMVERGQKPPRRVMVEAINAANDVTTNFKRMGTNMRAMNRMVPFLNAGLEGLDKGFRTIRDQPAVTMWRAAALAGATLAWWLSVKDDDWYKESPTWLRYGYWTLADDEGKPWLRVPRPFEWGYTISAGVQAMADQIAENNPEALDQWVDHMARSSTPNLLPAGISQAAQLLANEDFFKGTPIIPEALEDASPRNQYTRRTLEASRTVAGWLRSIGIDVSPAKIEWLVDDISGGIYRRAFDGNYFDLFRGFQLRQDYSQSMDDFYERKQDLDTAKRDDSLEGRQRPVDREAETAYYQDWSEIINDIRDVVRTHKDATRDERHEYERWLIGASRAAVGREPLARYPNPLNDPERPAWLEPIRLKHLGSALVMTTNSEPAGEKATVVKDGERMSPRDKWLADQMRSERILEGIGVDERQKLLRDYWVSLGRSARVRASTGRLTALGRRLLRMSSTQDGESVDP